MLRAFAGLLALVLALGGYAAVAAPLHGATAKVTQAGDGEDCGHHAAAAVTKPDHAGGDCCRSHCACTAGHALGSLPAPLFASGIVPTQALPPLRGDGLRIARGDPPLRPPAA